MIAMENRIVIDTPENISFHYKVADLGSRCIAVFIDTLIQVAIYISLAVGAFYLRVEFEQLANWVLALVILIVFLIFVFYFVLLETVTHGQSVGKRIMRLRVIRADGQPLTLIDSVLRNMLRLIDFFPGSYAIGVIVMFLSGDAKRLGDLAAQTIVVREGSRITLSSLLKQAGPSTAIPEYADVFDQHARRLDESEAASIESLLRRWAVLRNADEIARALDTSIRARIGSDELDAVAMQLGSRVFVEQLVSAYRQRTTGV
jgi:uncharacterized RDD family membrane protein YckC